MFYVVHVDNWFQIIPENWLDKEKKIIYWPTEKNVTIATWIKKQIPYKSNWEKYNYNCLFGPFENYNESKNFEKQCTGYSSQDKILYDKFIKNNELSQKRSRKKNPKFFQTEDERISSESESEGDKQAKKKPKITSMSKLQSLPPQLDYILMETLGSRTTGSKSNQFASTSSDNTIDNETSEYINNATKNTYDKNSIPTTSKQLTTISDNVIHNETSKCTNIIINKTCDTTFEDDDNDDDFDLKNSTELQPVHTKPIIISLDARNETFDIHGNNINISNTSEGTSQTVMNKRTSKTTRTVNDITVNRGNIGCNCCPCIDKINKKLDIIIHILQSKNKNKENNTILENIEFYQLQTKEEFDALEKSLAEDAKKREQLKTLIKQEGGKNAADHIRRAMRRIITDHLAVQYSWSGQKNTIRFKDSLISKLILNTVTSLHTSNIKTAEDAIQSWLNHASDRIKKAGRTETHHSWKKDLITTDIVTDRVNVFVKEEIEKEIKIETEIEIDTENEGM